MKRFVVCVLVGIILLIGNVCIAEELASIATSGMFIKDKLVVEVFDDPDIPGVSCYATFPKRALSFKDQTDSSISCRQIGPINKNRLHSRKDIFRVSKSIMFKKFHMDRIYDKRRNVLVYVGYTTKLTGDNANNSVSVVVVK